MKITVLFHNKEWLWRNAYQDSQSDWWPSKEDYVTWDEGRKSADYNPELFPDFLLDTDVGVIEENLEDDFDFIKWAVEKVLTEESDPEYFL